MPLLFSYGTLQQKGVQVANFGRELSGISDTLQGYVVGEIEIRDERVLRESGKAKHPILQFTGNMKDEVHGTVFEVTESELAQADDYEVEDYKRISVRSKSGAQCWIYAESKSAEYAGSCLCGAVRFEVSGAFDSFYLCHCRYCQKDTGSAHAANLFSQSARIKWQSGEEAVSSFTLPGTRHTKSFCKFCGSAMPSIALAGMLVVPAGCLDTNAALVPTAHICTSSKADWSLELGHVPQFEGLPELQGAR